MFCPKCGQANHESALACIRCGETLQRASYARPQTSGKAIASMVTSLVGLFSCPFVCDIVGIVLGYSARREIRLSRGRLTGDGFAIAGIAVGWTALGLHVLVAIIWVAIFTLALFAGEL